MDRRHGDRGRQGKRRGHLCTQGGQVRRVAGIRRPLRRVRLRAVESGATVRFCRLDTYRHHMSLKDMPREDYAAFQIEKRTLRSRFGVWGLKPRAHESPPVWDGEFE